MTLKKDIESAFPEKKSIREKISDILAFIFAYFKKIITYFCVIKNVLLKQMQNINLSNKINPLKGYNRIYKGFIFFGMYFLVVIYDFIDFCMLIYFHFKKNF